MEGKKIVKIILIIVVLLILIDQVSKILVSNFVTEDIVLLQNVFAISKVQSDDSGINKQDITNVAIMALILAVVIRFVVIQKHNLQKFTVLFLGMIIAGETSNILDIIFRGGILEFIQLGDFPVFNLADSFIVIGWILFIIDLVKRIREVS